MTIRCPICRAANDTGPVCRRCKADLAPLVELEERRAHILERAAKAAAVGDLAAVLRHARHAQLLRAGGDATRWLAVGHLLRGDFAAASVHYRLAIAAAPV
jgi:hypothetical protein